MKKLNFSLTTLLLVRKLKEDITHRALMESQLFLNKMVGILIKHYAELDKLQTEMRHGQTGSVNVHNLKNLHNCIEILKIKIESQKTLIKEAEISLELKRQAVVKAMQQRKIIENLKEKKFTEWEGELLHKENAEHDELSTMRFSKTHT